VNQLIYLLDSHMKKEREIIAEILLGIYEKYVAKRKCIRESIIHCFENIIHDNQSFNGIPELLDLYLVIIRGFKVPLKQTNTEFFERILLPLHKVQNIHSFFSNLLNCCVLYITKESKLVNKFIEYLTRHLPFGFSAKEEVFLYEIDEVFHHVDFNDVDQTVFVKLCKRTLRLINDGPLPSAIKGMSLVNNDNFLKLLYAYRSSVLKLFYPALDSLFQRDLYEEYYDLLTLIEYRLSKLDQDTYELFLKERDEKDGTEKKVTNEGKWNKLDKLAKEVCRQHETPIIPYSENTCLTMYNEIYHQIANKDVRAD